MSIEAFNLDKISLSNESMREIVDRDLVIFDKEFINLWHKMRDVFESFNEIFYRWKRSENVSISKNVFDYKRGVKYRINHLSAYYSFRLDDVHIWLDTLGSKGYFLRIENFNNIDRDRYNRYGFTHFSEENFSSLISQPFENFDDALHSYYDMVNHFIYYFDLQCREALF